MKSLLNRTKFGIIAIFLILGGCASCGTNTQTNTRIENRVPRKAFIRIQVEATVNKCELVNKKLTNCTKTRQVVAHASGAIVGRSQKGSRILTAGHVCDRKDLLGYFDPKTTSVKVNYIMIAYNNQRHSAQVIRLDPTIDSCLLWAEGMTRWRPLKVRRDEPKYAEKLYNIANPLGVATEGSTPFLEGRFIGNTSISKAQYSIPAAPGSSGSPIFDKRGYLVGMIHSVLYRFHHISVGPTHKKLIEFLED